MIPTFWVWLISGIGTAPSGLRNIFNKSFAIHIIIALALLIFLRIDAYSFAAKALFPAASILVSMSIAWTARASAIFQDKEFRKKLFTNNTPAEDYIYGYQLSLLTVIIVVCYTAIMSTGGLDVVVFSPSLDYRISAFTLFLLLSLGVRECWGAINFSNLLALIQYRES